MSRLRLKSIAILWRVKTLRDSNSTTSFAGFIQFAQKEPCQKMLRF